MKQVDYMLDLLKKRKKSCFRDKRELIMIKRSEETLESLKKFLIEGKRLGNQIK